VSVTTEINRAPPIVLRRRALDGHGDHRLTTDEHEAKRALLLTLLLLALDGDLVRVPREVLKLLLAKGLERAGHVLGERLLGLRRGRR
jgi:hypothetical protein